MGNSYYCIALKYTLVGLQYYTMDCVIPSHSVRPFCAAIGCLSRIGKELYVDFDPIDGLTLRALNDAKSVFCSFQYEPSFFERCTAPPTVVSRKRRATNSSASNSTQNDRLSVRLALKALSVVVRARKNVLSLRIQTTNDNSFLAFEFQLQKQNSVVRVIHRIGVADAQGVAAVAPTEGASEMVVSPSTLLRMLEPLKRTPEMALIVNDTLKLVSAVTFHQDDIQEETSVLTKPTLKTETSIGCDDLMDFDYQSHPVLDDNDPLPPPADLQNQVILVFTIKEFKAMLQFCNQAYVDQELRVSISFYWGGKPMVVKTSSEGCSAQLVMATLDHNLLGAMKTSASSSRGGGAAVAEEHE
jgi:hypothetical protein